MCNLILSRLIIVVAHCVAKAGLSFALSLSLSCSFSISRMNLGVVGHRRRYRRDARECQVHDTVRLGCWSVSIFNCATQKHDLLDFAFFPFRLSLSLLLLLLHFYLFRIARMASDALKNGHSGSYQRVRETFNGESEGKSRKANNCMV